MTNTAQSFKSPSQEREETAQINKPKLLSQRSFHLFQKSRCGIDLRLQNFKRLRVGFCARHYMMKQARVFRELNGKNLQNAAHIAVCKVDRAWIKDCSIIPGKGVKYRITQRMLTRTTRLCSAAGLVSMSVIMKQ